MTLIERLRQATGMDEQLCSDEELLRVTEDTLVRAVVELRQALHELRVELQAALRGGR